jgi:hypothetical protein
MNRRDFLKLAAAGSLAVIMTQFIHEFYSISFSDASPGDIVPKLGRKLFQGTSDGRILTSADGGLSWRCCANFGGQNQVKDLYASGGKLFAEIYLQGNSFELTSTDGRFWYTVS